MAIPWKYEETAASCLGRLSLTRPMGHWIPPELHEPTCCAARNYHTNWCLKCSCEDAQVYLNGQIAWEDELFERWYSTQVPWWRKVFHNKNTMIYNKRIWAMSHPLHANRRRYQDILALAAYK